VLGLVPLTLGPSPEVAVDVVLSTVRPQARTNGRTRLQNVSVATGSYSADSVGSVNRWPSPG